MAEQLPESGPPTADPARLEEATVYLWQALKANAEWTRFADAKAGAILTANGVLGTIAAGLSRANWGDLDSHWVLWLVSRAGVVALIVSTIACVKCLYPRLKVPREAKSLIFFHHIAARFPEPADYLKAADALREPRVAFEEVGIQVWASAKVAREKHKEVAITIAATGTCLLAALAHVLLNR